MKKNKKKSEGDDDDSQKDHTKKESTKLGARVSHRNTYLGERKNMQLKVQERSFIAAERQCKRTSHEHTAPTLLNSAPGWKYVAIPLVLLLLYYQVLDTVVIEIKNENRERIRCHVPIYSQKINAQQCK
jgi:hypothetical protein